MTTPPGGPPARAAGAVPAATVVVVLGLLAVVVLAIAILGGIAPSRLDPNPIATSRPVVGFIGDSYIAAPTTSSGAPFGAGATAMTTVLGRRHGWRVVNGAVGGTGYVVAPSGAAPFAAAQEQPIVAARPALVVIAGSRNDAAAAPEAVRTAAGGLYRTLGAALPDARIVVVGPMWTTSDPPATVRAIRDAVSRAASEAHLTFIDPIGERWFDDPALIGPDGVHPSPAGQQRMADRLDADLIAAGALPEGSLR